MSALASQVAYSLIFAIPSLILFLMAMAAVIERQFDVPIASTLRDAIDEYAPDAVRELLIAIVDQAITQVSSGVASVSAIVAVIVAIWGASGGINALMNACNRAYGVPDTRTFVSKRILALMLTAVFAVFTVLTSALFIGGRMLERRFFNAVDVSDRVQDAWEVLRWPAIALPIVIALWMLYTIGPAARPPLRWTIPGAIVASVIWLGVLWGFRGILEIINPGSPYGATGSVLVLLFFLYTTGVVFILGAAINGLLVQHVRGEW